MKTTTIKITTTKLHVLHTAIRNNVKQVFRYGISSQ